MKNYYEILEVNKKASREVIDKAYKVLAKKYHPDLYSGEKKAYAEKKIKEINEAYRVLSDEFLKEQYDSEYMKQEIENQNAKYQRLYNEVKNEKTVSKNQPDTVSQGKYQNIGTFKGIIDLCKELYKNKPKRDEIKNITQKDILAIALTIVVVIMIGIVLWFVPFTNGFMRELLIDNPIVSGISHIFK